MDKTFQLPRTRQCKKCPWKVSTNPYDIPDDYDLEKHKALINTIAEPGVYKPAERVMACHHSDGSDRMFCVGWLYNQLGKGNNIGLRIAMSKCDKVGEIQVVGEQHERFQDTLPTNLQ